MSSECFLLRLPPEILQHILLKCSAQDLAMLATSCTQLYSAIQDDRIWKNLAKTEYHIEELTGRVLNTYKKLYQRILHPYGWIIGPYWSRIDYFGGLLEVKVSGDSIVAVSLKVQADGASLEEHESFSVTASLHHCERQLCSMIERPHSTHITLCKDGESLRQKCQFHDTKFAQGHYNYNTLEGFRAMTFIDAHRMGIIHHPLVIPDLSSIPKELLLSITVPSIHNGGVKSTASITNSPSKLSVPPPSPSITNSPSKLSVPPPSPSSNSVLSELLSNPVLNRLIGNYHVQLPSGSGGERVCAAAAAAAGGRSVQVENGEAGGGLNTVNMDGECSMRNKLLSQSNGDCSGSSTAYLKHHIQNSQPDNARQNNSAEGDNLLRQHGSIHTTNRYGESSTGNGSQSSTQRGKTRPPISPFKRTDRSNCSLGNNTDRNIHHSAENNADGNHHSAAVEKASGRNSHQSSIDKTHHQGSDLDRNYKQSSAGGTLNHQSFVNDRNHQQSSNMDRISNHQNYERDNRRGLTTLEIEKKKRRWLPSPAVPWPVKAEDLPPHVLIPGLYAAHYGVHGYEILLLEYKFREVTMLKILGDQYVPTREISIKFCLPFSMSLSREQQQLLTCADLYKMEPESNKLTPLNTYHRQPFLLPPYCEGSDQPYKVPDTCWARYHGFGQLANIFHSQPKFTRVHVVVFNNEELGVLHLKLNKFMVFRRIKRDFPKRPNIARRRVSSGTFYTFNEKI